MDPEVSITVDTKEDVWVMIGEGMVMVMWVVKGEMFWTRAISEIEEKSGVEDSKDGKWKLTAGSGEEDTKSFSVPDDVDRVTEGTCTGILKIGACELLWTWAISGIQESSAVEDSEDGKSRLRAGSGEEDTKTFSVRDDVDKVIDDSSRGIFKIGAYEMFWTWSIWTIEEESEVEDSKDGKWRLTVGCGEKDTKTFSVLDDVDRVIDGKCKGILKIGASEIAGSEMEVCTGSDVIDLGVEVKSW